MRWWTSLSGRQRLWLRPIVQDGWVEWKDESEFGTGSFGYRHLGILSNGVHVLLTQWSGGGSGVFRNLLFLRVR